MKRAILFLCLTLLGLTVTIGTILYYMQKPNIPNSEEINISSALIPHVDNVIVPSNASYVDRLLWIEQMICRGSFLRLKSDRSIEKIYLQELALPVNDSYMKYVRDLVGNTGQGEDNVMRAGKVTIAYYDYLKSQKYFQSSKSRALFYNKLLEINQHCFSAHLALGQMLLVGYDVPADPISAITHLEQFRDSIGGPIVYNLLGIIYFENYSHLGSDIAKSMYHFAAAATLGSKDAEDNLQLLISGRDTRTPSISYAASFECYVKRKDYARANRQLGLLRMQDFETLPKQIVFAKQYFARACKLGDIQSCGYLDNLLTGKDFDRGSWTQLIPFSENYIQQKEDVCAIQLPLKS
ncbi:MAG: hypothetical protein QM538_03080 [Methylacidiphilales bacterium]|nr:hypothetical protein [Candidatus Methylacidiphilales bacterium]